jgi:putative ABC transport system permease protein
LNPYTFHINLYDLIFLGAIFIGLTFALLLWFAPKINRAANRFLALALAVIVLWLARVLGIDIGVTAYIPHWSWFPLQFSLALGPLIFFYVLKITRPDYKLRFKDFLHFIPLLLELYAQVLEINESTRTGVALYQTMIFRQLIPVLQLLAFVSVITYLYWSRILIERFYGRLKFNGGDRYRYELQWLDTLLKNFALLWLLWIPFIAVDYFGYHYRLGINAYYPLYLLLAIIFTRIAILSFLRPEAGARPSFRPLLPAELKQKGTWLKNVVKANRYYQDESLSLNSLAEKLNLSPHELSRIINSAFKKSFSDFINEFRVADVARKMQDPAYNHITLLGIAFEAGFNSKTTFHRIFKQITGKSPAEYKTEQKKDIPSYNLELYSHGAAVNSYQQNAPKWYEKLNCSYMFKIYLKNAWRHIIRHKTYSAINVMGLALGICGCLVIYLITSFEFSFDTFHPDKERIYCIDVSNPSVPDPARIHLNMVFPPLPAAMRNNMSGLEKVATFQPYRPKVKIKDGDKVIKRFDETEAIIAEPDYFDILSYTWLSGNQKTALNEPMCVVLTQSRAKTYFGDIPATSMIGKTIIYEDSLIVRVTGILKDWNKNSDFNFSDFISYSTINNSFLKYQMPQDDWHTITGTQELVKLPPGVNPSQIDAQFPSFIKKHLDPDPHTPLHIQLQPFTGIHFHREYGGFGNKADLRVLYILSAVAIFILFIAAINFINLSTAQSIQRTKEIGILKVMGSGRRTILIQFLIETFTLAFVAMAIAVIAVQPLLNLFAEYIPPGVKFHYSDYVTWIFLVGVVIFTTLLAGLYPARLLSVFKPVSSLKGEVSERAGNKGYLRKSLIVFQFTISLIFIIGTIAISKQINYMQNQDLGVKTSNIITLRRLMRDRTSKMQVLAERIKQFPGIEQVITEGPPPIGLMHRNDPAHLQGSNEEPVETYFLSGNENFVPFYHMKIVAGRNLLHSDSIREYVLNETAVRALGFRDPKQAVGRLLLWADKKAYPIAGVVADFYEDSFYQRIRPCVIANDPTFQKGIALKLTPVEYKKSDIPLLINNVAKEWKKLYPEEPFDYAFLGDTITKLYQSEQQTQWLMGTATLITIFISCMGLFGLAMFTTERRTKEISIRKVMGASVTNILAMLNKEVVVLIAISLLISSPIAWFFINKWLQNFAYHTNLSFWIFILAGAGAMLIALATISFRTIRSATKNPVNGLRNE